MKLKVKKLYDGVIVPSYAKEGDAGFDLYSADDYVISPGKRELVKTGLAFEIPLGYEVQIRPRSGLALKRGISVVNSPGTIDSGYRGEIGVVLINHGEENFEVNRGDRIAQGVLNKVEIADFVESEVLMSSVRGERGFGSSGAD